MKLRALEALEDRPRKTMACPTANLLYSYFLDTAVAIQWKLARIDRRRALRRIRVSPSPLSGDPTAHPVTPKPDGAPDVRS